MTFDVDEYGFVTMHVSCPLAGGDDIKVKLFPDLEDGGVSDTMQDSLRDLEALGQEHKDTVASMLLEHAESCFESTSYGYAESSDLEDETEINREAFSVRTPANAFRAARLAGASIELEDALTHRYAVLEFDVPWEEEHGCGIVLRDGRPIGWGSADIHGGQFEAVA